MKFKSYLIHGIISLVCVLLLMINRGLFTAVEAKDKVLAAADGFTAVALIYLGFGLLVWISSVGVFDMLRYAIQKGAHSLIPGLFKFEAEDFYEYKLELKEKQKKTSYPVILQIGLVLFVISVILVVIWYKISGNM